MTDIEIVKLESEINNKLVIRDEDKEFSRLLELKYNKDGRICINCDKQSSFGYKDMAFYCFDCKMPDMVDTRHKKCIGKNKDGSNCLTLPTYNYVGEKKAIYCNAHYLNNMVNIIDSKCTFIFDDGKRCNSIPSYRTLTVKKATRCALHKIKGMITKDLIICQGINFDGTNCTKQKPIYNLPGEIRGKFCFEHKIKDMINVITKKCEHTGCDAIASYGTLGGSVQYCLKHSEDMINLRAKICNGYTDNIKCIKYATFHAANGKKYYCVVHKTADMISTEARICTNINKDGIKCITRATFGYISDTKPTRCAKHKEDRIDIIYKRCTYINPVSGIKCNAKATRGKLWDIKIHCLEHGDKNEYEYNKPKCIEDKCKIKPVYSDTNYPKRCETHKLDTDLNIIEKACNSCGLTYYLNELNLCNDCNDFIAYKRNKVKETDIKLLLEHNNIKCESYDKIPKNACSRYRPDFVIDYDIFMIILEVDENQHKSYVCECEVLRMVQLFQDMGGIPVIFIRYNPDNYKDNLDKIVKPSNSRKTKLLKLLNDLWNYKEWTNPLSVIYMFYDGYNGIPKIDIIDYENVRSISEIV